MPYARRRHSARGQTPTGTHPPRWLQRFRRGLLAADARVSDSENFGDGAAWLHRADQRTHTK